MDVSLCLKNKDLIIYTHINFQIYNWCFNHLQFAMDLLGVSSIQNSRLRQPQIRGKFRL